MICHVEFSSHSQYGELQRPLEEAQRLKKADKLFLIFRDITKKGYIQFKRKRTLDALREIKVCSDPGSIKKLYNMGE